MFAHPAVPRTSGGRPQQVEEPERWTPGAEFMMNATTQKHEQIHEYSVKEVADASYLMSKELGVSSQGV